jgi:hypothetical protein
MITLPSIDNNLFTGTVDLSPSTKQNFSLRSRLTFPFCQTHCTSVVMAAGLDILAVE